MCQRLIHTVHKVDKDSKNKKKPEHKTMNNDRTHYGFLCLNLNYKLIHSFLIYLLLFAPVDHVFIQLFFMSLFPSRFFLLSVRVSMFVAFRAFWKVEFRYRQDGTFFIFIRQRVQVAKINFASTYWLDVQNVCASANDASSTIEYSANCNDAIMRYNRQYLQWQRWET